MTFSQKIFYTTLAGLIFLVHLLLVLIVSLGWLVPGLFYVFLGAIIATFLSEIFLGYCVLSKWEFFLRRKLDPMREYDKSCIVHYTRALFGLKPRIISHLPKTFLKKYSFLFILLILLAVGVGYHVYF